MASNNNPTVGSENAPIDRENIVQIVKTRALVSANSFSRRRGRVLDFEEQQLIRVRSQLSNSKKISTLLLNLVEVRDQEIRTLEASPRNHQKISSRRSRSGPGRCGRAAFSAGRAGRAATRTRPSLLFFNRPPREGPFAISMLKICLKALNLRGRKQ